MSEGPVALVMVVGAANRDGALLVVKSSFGAESHRTICYRMLKPEKVEECLSDFV